jgi:hypothetical protein
MPLTCLPDASQMSKQVASQLEQLGYAPPADDQMQDLDHPASSPTMPMFMQSLAKNVLSPPSGVGHNTRQQVVQPLMTASPKAKAAPEQSKGKGGGKSKEKGKTGSRNSGASGKEKGKKGKGRGKGPQ